MAVDVQDISRMLLGAGRDQQVRQRYAVLAAFGELALRSRGGAERLRVHPQLAKRIQVPFKRFEVLGRARAVEQLQTGHGAQAELTELSGGTLSAYES